MFGSDGEGCVLTKCLLLRLKHFFAAHKRLKQAPESRNEGEVWSIDKTL